MGPTYPDPREVELGYFEFSTHLLALEVLRRGHEVSWLNRSYFVTEVAGHTIGFWCTRSNLISSVAAKTAARKDMTTRLLAQRGISVADSSTVSVKDPWKALQLANELGYPIVVKPVSGMKGRGVTVDVRSDRAFRAAWNVALEAGAARIMLERFFPGKEARFLVVGDRSVAAVAKIPPHVVGDGTSTIQQLIDRKNEARKANPHLGKRPITMSAYRIKRLRSQKLKLDSVLEDEQHVELDSKAAFSDGGESVDITDVVHPSYHEVVGEIGRAFPGLDLAGVDLLAIDLEAPATPDNYVVCEVNSMPALGAHHFPGVGQPRDVAKLIIDQAFEHAQRLTELGAPRV